MWRFGAIRITSGSSNGLALVEQDGKHGISTIMGRLCGRRGNDKLNEQLRKIQYYDF